MSFTIWSLSEKGFCFFHWITLLFSKNILNLSLAPSLSNNTSLEKLHHPCLSFFICWLENKKPYLLGWLWGLSGIIQARWLEAGSPALGQKCRSCFSNVFANEARHFSFSLQLPVILIIHRKIHVPLSHHYVHTYVCIMDVSVCKMHVSFMCVYVLWMYLCMMHVSFMLCVYRWGM